MFSPLRRDHEKGCLNNEKVTADTVTADGWAILLDKTCTTYYLWTGDMHSAQNCCAPTCLRIATNCKKMHHVVV